MSDDATSNDFLKRIKAEKKMRLAQALKLVETYQHEPDSVPENQRIELGLSSYFLAKQYRYGEGTEPNYTLSFICYKLSAQLGNPRACYTLGRMYLLGNKAMNIKKNHPLALSYIEMYDHQQCGISLREKLDNLKKVIRTVSNAKRAFFISDRHR